MTAPILPWRPDLRAAIEAIAAGADVSPADLLEHPDFAESLRNDARAVLDASGANAEIERMRAVLHAAHGTLATLREENQHLLSLALALTLEPVIADMPSNDELRAAAEIDGFPPSESESA